MTVDHFGRFLRFMSLIFATLKSVIEMIWWFTPDHLNFVQENRSFYKRPWIEIILSSSLIFDRLIVIGNIEYFISEMILIIFFLVSNSVYFLIFIFGSVDWYPLHFVTHSQKYYVWSAWTTFSEVLFSISEFFHVELPDPPSGASQVWFLLGI